MRRLQRPPETPQKWHGGWRGTRAAECQLQESPRKATDAAGGLRGPLLASARLRGPVGGCAGASMKRCMRSWTACAILKWWRGWEMAGIAHAQNCAPNSKMAAPMTPFFWIMKGGSLLSQTSCRYPNVSGQYRMCGHPGHINFIRDWNGRGGVKKITIERCANAKCKNSTFYCSHTYIT